MTNEKPNYYAIIPANVRYDKNLNSTEKLLYSEIVALSNKEGVCWASNKYFANLYNVTTIYISNMIKKLKLYGYIKTELIYKENSKQIKQRNIYILNNSLIPIKQKFKGPTKQKFKDNNININNKYNKGSKQQNQNYNNEVLIDDPEELFDN